jgi:hypothetical protein
VIKGIAMTGGPGQAVSFIVDVMWSQGDAWDEIKDRVEQLVNRKIAEQKYRDVKARLEGLRSLLHDYHETLKLGTATKEHREAISRAYDTTQSQFRVEVPTFQTEGDEVLLLPLFAQVANLHLAHLSEGIAGGPSWDWDDARLTLEQKRLKEDIASYTSWAATTFDLGLSAYEVSPDIDKWQARNHYIRQMTLDVLDHAHFWPFVGSKEHQFYVPWPKRTIYTEPVGGIHANYRRHRYTNDIVVAGLEAQKAGPMAGLQFWGNDEIWGVHVWFSGGEIVESVSQWRPDRPNHDEELLRLGHPSRVITGVSGRLGPPSNNAIGYAWDLGGDPTSHLADEERRDLPLVVCSSLSVTVTGIPEPVVMFGNGLNHNWRFDFPDEEMSMAIIQTGRYPALLFGFRFPAGY